jgi:hypothetical protein
VPATSSETLQETLVRRRGFVLTSLLSERDAPFSFSILSPLRRLKHRVILTKIGNCAQSFCSTAILAVEQVGVSPAVRTY